MDLWLKSTEILLESIFSLLFLSSLRAFSTLLWSYFCFEIILKACTSLADFYTHTFAKFVLGKEQGTEVPALRIICCNNSNVMEKSNEAIAFQMTASDPWQWMFDHNLTHKRVLLLGNTKLLNTHQFQGGCCWCFFILYFWSE